MLWAPHGAWCATEDGAPPRAEIKVTSYTPPPRAAPGPVPNRYCGETSIQMAALSFGAWISQALIRSAGGGQQDGGQLLLPLDPAVWNVAGIGRNMYLALGWWRASTLHCFHATLCASQLGRRTPHKPAVAPTPAPPRQPI